VNGEIHGVVIFDFRGSNHSGKPTLDALYVPDTHEGKGIGRGLIERGRAVRPIRSAITSSRSVPSSTSCSGVHPPFVGVHRGPGMSPSRLALFDFLILSSLVHTFFLGPSPESVDDFMMYTRAEGVEPDFCNWS
jgi:hypothetical protein